MKSLLISSSLLFLLLFSHIQCIKEESKEVDDLSIEDDDIEVDEETKEKAHEPAHHHREQVDEDEFDDSELSLSLSLSEPSLDISNCFANSP